MHELRVLVALQWQNADKNRNAKLLASLDRLLGNSFIKHGLCVNHMRARINGGDALGQGRSSSSTHRNNPFNQRIVRTQRATQ